MDGLTFLLGLLCLISADAFLLFLFFIFYKYMDLKYFCKESTEVLENTEEKSFWG